MTTTQSDTVLFKDQTGNYYLLPQQVLERGRVAAEHTAEVGRLLAAAKADDVAGHLLGIGLVVGAAISQRNQPLRNVINQAVADFESQTR